MKTNKLKITITTILIAFTTISIAQSPNSNEKITIKSEQFTTLLLNNWITEYSKSNPSIQIEIATKETPDDEIDLFLSNEKTVENNPTNHVSVVGRYAILPISNIENPFLREKNIQKFNSKLLKELFFEKDVLEQNPKKKKDIYEDVTIYSGNNSASGAEVFANHFGYQVENIKGKKIIGDDVFLVNAIQKDNSGITFNKINYLFDLQSRKLKSNILVLPIDLKKEFAEKLNSSTLDELISLLESEKNELIPIANIQFSYEDKNPETIQFIKWVLENGQKTNHQFGFLNLEPKEFASQVKKLDEIYLTLRN